MRLDHVRLRGWEPGSDAGMLTTMHNWCTLDCVKSLYIFDGFHKKVNLYYCHCRGENAGASARVL